ncbi:MAG: SGNH/GDSL hydrolase family protein [Actinomycetota bacterium]|nr:SGNH/GDSL hydrolase family protein [Actinomycetota bacterium]
MKRVSAAALVTRVTRVTIVTIAIALMGAGCSDDGVGVQNSVIPDERPRLLYVAVGASETFGMGATDPSREAWPEVFFRTALPRRARFVNLGIPGATVADAIAQEARYAASLKPEIVTVWLNVNDILSGVDVDAYERDLDRLLRLLTTDEETTVLVANTPPLEWLPSFRACLPSPPKGAPECDLKFTSPRPNVVDRLIESYNKAIARTAARVGAWVVDLHSATLALALRGRVEDLVARDGFHPSTEGHKEVAKAFAEVFAANSR